MTSKAPIVAVTGGKGGTGKTVVATNLAYALCRNGYEVLLVDCDVDAPNTYVALGVSLTAKAAVEIFKPEVNKEKCTKCGRCVQVCKEHALVGGPGYYPFLIEDLCSGCKACSIACPVSAIEGGKKVLGEVLEGRSNGLRLVVGRLRPTEARSPVVARKTLLVALEEADNYDLVIVDTAPGVHNAVAQALWTSSLALAVTEPTPLGLHDLELVLSLLEQLSTPSAVVVNKSGISPEYEEEISRRCAERGFEVVASVPYSEEVLQSYLGRTPVLRMYPNSPASKAFEDLARFVENALDLGGG